MPNLYATPTEIKAAAPGIIQSGITTYDSALLQMANRISRLIDRFCGRVFFPTIETRYLSGDDTEELWIPDIITVTTVSYSDDSGANYTALVDGTDFHATVAGDHFGKRSYSRLEAHPSGDLLTWPSGYRSIKVVGVWAYADNRDEAWEDSLGTSGATLGTTGTALTFASTVAGADQWGVTPRLQPGHLIKLDSEFLELTAASGTSGTVVRARNGSTAALHGTGAVAYVWRPPDPVKQAAIIQATRQLERGLQGFGDARATAEIGDLVFVKGLDPEAQILLEHYRTLVIA